MSYQPSLFDGDTMQDRSGRCKDYPAPPATYGDCLGRKHLRALPPDDPNAERCQALGCRHNLIGELGRIKKDDELEAAISMRYEAGEWSTCALDVVEDFPNDERVGLCIGAKNGKIMHLVYRAQAAMKSAVLEDNRRREREEYQARKY